MAAPAAQNLRTNTFTLTLVQGESANPTATFSAVMSARTVIVGTGPKAQWKLRAQGVEAVHAELHWDGAVLWVRDAGSLGGVYVGNDRVGDWQQLFDGTEVALGQAVVHVRVVGPDAREPAAGDVTQAGDAHEPAADDDFEEPTNVGDRAALDDALAAGDIDGDSDGESTVVFSDNARHAFRDAPTAPAVPAPRVPSVPPAAAIPAPRQRIATAAAPQAAYSVPPPAVVRPASSEETVIRPSPYAAALEGASPRPAAGAPSGDRNSMPDERTMMHGDMQAILQTGPPMPSVPSVPSVMVSQSQFNMQAANVPTPPAPVGMAPAMMNLGGYGSFQPGPQGYDGQGSPNVTAPSGFGGDDPFGPMAYPPPSGPAAVPPPTSGLDALAAKLKVPARTLVLGLGTLVIALLALLIPSAAPPARPGTPGMPNGTSPGTPPGAVLPGTPPGTNGAAPGPLQFVSTVAAAPPASNNILGLPTGAPGLVGVIVPAPVPAAAPGRPVTPPPSNPQDPILRAAEMAATHRYADAAALYDQLATQHPEAPLFRQFAIVLRAKLNVPCQPGTPGCTTPPTPAPAAPAAPPPSAPSSPPSSPAGPSAPR